MRKTRYDFDKTERRMMRGFVAMWVIGLLVWLGGIALVAWAVISLVQHFTG